MAIVTAGLYKLELFQLLQNQEIINTFWYLNTEGNDGVAQNVIDGFEGIAITDVANAQSTDLTYTKYRCTPIFGTAAEVEDTVGEVNGNVVGDTMPPFMAASIRLNRGTNELRSGWKRFAGLVEQNVQQTTFTAGYLILLDSLAAKLDNQLSPAGLFFDPVIVRKPFSTLAQSPNWEAIPVASTTAVNRPTTQNSRKPF